MHIRMRICRVISCGSEKTIVLANFHYYPNRVKCDKFEKKLDVRCLVCEKQEKSV